ncbi:MAG: glutathione synthase [Candidatus Gastranaerophilaceae bacterium]|jgi:glutathione synthase
MSFKLLFIIDKVEFQYFEMNELVTSFWLIKEALRRGWDIFITTQDRLFLYNNTPHSLAFKTTLTQELVREKNPSQVMLNDFDMILFRPDPPVDIDYINSTYVLDFVDTSKTLVINSPSGIRKANEKLYINNFKSVVPENISTSNAGLIKDFVNECGEVILKPLNKCFGKGVFYLKKGDKNINTIIETATNGGKTIVMAQQYLEKVKEGDKRVIIIGGEIFEETIVKVSGEGDFKFNNHSDEFFRKGYITDEDREICRVISPKLIEDGLLLVGLDVIDGKMIEINVTSPCFFIKEINQMFNTKLEEKIVNYLENLLSYPKGYLKI